jgi:hypothetical protein
MTLTRKDFTLIAEVQRRMMQLEMTDTERTAVIKTILALADELAGTNPRFDRKRFLDACGIAEGELQIGRRDIKGTRPDGAEDLAKF